MSIWLTTHLLFSLTSHSNPLLHWHTKQLAQPFPHIFPFLPIQTELTPSRPLLKPKNVYFSPTLWLTSPFMNLSVLAWFLKHWEINLEPAMKSNKYEYTLYRNDQWMTKESNPWQKTQGMQHFTSQVKIITKIWVIFCCP